MYCQYSGSTAWSVDVSYAAKTLNRPIGWAGWSEYSLATLFFKRDSHDLVHMIVNKEIVYISCFLSLLKTYFDSLSDSSMMSRHGLNQNNVCLILTQLLMTFLKLFYFLLNLFSAKTLLFVSSLVLKEKVAVRRDLICVYYVYT